MENTSKVQAAATVYELLQQQAEQREELIKSLPERFLFHFNSSRYNSLLNELMETINVRNKAIDIYLSLFPDFGPITEKKFEEDILPLLRRKEDNLLSTLKLLWLEHEGAVLGVKTKRKDIALKASKAPEFLAQFDMEYPEDLNKATRDLHQLSPNVPYGISGLAFKAGKFLIDEKVKKEATEYCSTYFTKGELEEYILAVEISHVFNKLSERNIGFSTSGELEYNSDFQGLSQFVDYDRPSELYRKKLYNYRPSKQKAKGAHADYKPSVEKKIKIQVL